VPLCPPQISYGLIRDRTRASAVRGRRLTAWAMVRPQPCLCYETTMKFTLIHLCAESRHNDDFTSGFQNPRWRIDIPLSFVEESSRGFPFQTFGLHSDICTSNNVPTSHYELYICLQVCRDLKYFTPTENLSGCTGLYLIQFEVEHLIPKLFTSVSCFVIMHQ
jgi:hypothetical protein